MWLLILLFVNVFAIQKKCPEKCTCYAHVAITCEELASNDLLQLAGLLLQTEWGSIKKLSIHYSPDFNLLLLPELSSLEVLDLSNNSLRNGWSVSPNKFKSLSKLVLENNNFSEISQGFLFPFPAIEELYLGHNDISTFGFDSLRMPKMRIIHLNNNNIYSIGMHVLRFMPYLHDVNLSGNLLTKFATSAFSLVSGLRYLDLSNNRIQSLECDTAQALPSIEIIDLSGNLLKSMPRLEMKDMTGLRTLNLSGNPIQIVGDHHISLDYLKVLDLSATDVRTIESGAFSAMHELHTLYLNRNSKLAFLSPTALENKTIFSLDLRNTGLRTIPTSVINNVAQIHLEGANLDCGCIVDQLSLIGTTTIPDWDSSSCRTRSGQTISLSEVSQRHLEVADYCKPEVLLPFGTDQKASLGQTFSLYCAGNYEDDIVTWKGPTGTVEIGNKPKKLSALKRLDYFTSTLFEPQTEPVQRNRTFATTEYYRFDVVLKSDEGFYECSINRGTTTVTRKLHLKVLEPPIHLTVTDVAVSSMHLVWNQNLDVQAADRVSMQIVSRNEENDYGRSVQLSLRSIYCSYNMINLTPNKNYSVCLQWLLTDDNSEIFSTCIRSRTKTIRSVFDELNPTALFTVLVIGVMVVVLLCVNRLWQRLHIYKSAKQQSKLIQSVSGQSILSHSFTTDTTMYENPQLELNCRSCQCDQVGPLL